jgi:hypothetical protein
LLLIFCGCFSPTSNPTSALPSDPIPVVERETKPAAKPADETPDRQPADKKPVPLTFEDLDISMEPDTLFEDWMLTLRVKSRLNQRVRITGFMCGGTVFMQSNIGQFVLLREKECPYGRGGQAHHAINVHLRPTDLIHFTTDPVTIEGNLTLAPFTGPNGKTWSLYRLDDALRVEP